MKKYKYSILGGTFDRFHSGHKALIKAACLQSEKVDIGITIEKFYKNKVLAHIIEPYTDRESAVKNFLEQNGFKEKVTIIQLEDIYGNGLKNKAIDAIFVTQDTVRNAELLNEKRKQQNFPQMEIVIIPFTLSEDGKPITAERIRRGEIDREGRVYKNLFQKNLILPEALREELRKPIGKITTDATAFRKNKNEMLITVGDIVTLTALNNGITPSVIIIDFKTQRQQLDEKELKEKLNTQERKHTNAPGSINSQTVEILQHKINQYTNTQQPQTLIIDGEEDLLTLPAVLLAPLETKIIYGQVGQGAVIVTISEETKKQIANLLKQFN
jgi:phosphopantetheine adenylyltransferase/uncharacterized protein (UPF0218 family)